ncbi:MAG: hypothetical protein Faunusvirus4_4 [Faunusvirus sp.]|jgi:hypothetical protein|uniref:Uncharacterized protein n=1 Tax=Faunusvirus sp. TaxID=2487766 RepID=A0A3G5A012_9VIRU|nr:MAG: hypothetical protein Faunusvirus4_4 [Faunusvirus sp.]
MYKLLILFGVCCTFVSVTKSEFTTTDIHAGKFVILPIKSKCLYDNHFNINLAFTTNGTTNNTAHAINNVSFYTASQSLCAFPDLNVDIIRENIYPSLSVMNISHHNGVIRSNIYDEFCFIFTNTERHDIVVKYQLTTDCVADVGTYIWGIVFYIAISCFALGLLCKCIHCTFTRPQTSATPAVTNSAV